MIDEECLSAGFRMALYGYMDREGTLLFRVDTHATRKKQEWGGASQIRIGRILLAANSQGARGISEA